MSNSGWKARLLGILVLNLGILLPLSGVATAATVRVECSNAKAKIKTIAGGLAQLSLSGPNTLLVSGTCNENVTIDSYELLKIEGNPTATIKGGTDINFDAVTITNARAVELVNLTVEGGGAGVVCGLDSSCRLTSVTARNALSVGAYCGNSSIMRLTSTTLENNGDYGLQLNTNSSVLMESSTIKGNGLVTGGAGIAMGSGSSLYASNSFIQDNGEEGGISTSTHATLELQRTILSGNQGDGVSLSGGSTAKVLGSTIMSNVGHGVRIGDLSYAKFGWIDLNVSGNATTPDVVCDPVSPATRGIRQVILKGGTTNCPVPEPATNP
jgi:hypothetical protein